MKKERPIERYLSLDGEKAGFLMSGGKGFYFFGGQFCEAICHRVILKSESTDIYAESHSDILALVRGNELCEAYIGGKRILRLIELLICYEIPMSGGSLYGVITGGREFPARNVQYANGQINDLILGICARRRSAEIADNAALTEVMKTLGANETKAVSSLYLTAKPLRKELINGKNI